ncbi:MAG: alkaline phosphatase D family protein [Acidimicrobiia bacterium]|nr:alkaline phosphatase D family protein [Acidimicrobiia bacterium]
MHEDSENDGLSRRRFVAAGAATAIAGPVLARTPVLGQTTIRTATPPLPGDPFTLGIASGDPYPRSVLLWTRLAPNPTETGGGMPDGSYRVRWEVANDERMRRVVRRGAVRTSADTAHSVHIDVRGLRPDREYFYRFRVGRHISPVGRTRTAPGWHQRIRELSFGAVNCQRYNSGLYTAYADLAEADLDLVVHVGDYIYETGGSGARTDPLPESISLDEYRNRYGLYKSDPLLMAAHASAPWLFTWDDHEVENNYTGLVPEIGSSTPDPAAFRARRAAGYRAYWEHMPMRGPAPTGPDLELHRRIRWGRLADIFVLDTRQFRTDQTCGTDDVGGLCPAAFDPATQVLGTEQERWLLDGLARTRRRWAVLAQQVVFSRLAIVPGNPGVYNLDQWDGYQAARQRILDTLAQHRPHDTVVLSGDFHASFVSDITADFDDPAAPVLGAEFVGTSVSSTGVPPAITNLFLNNNPNLLYANGEQRGWVRHVVRSGRWRADYRLVDDATVEGSPVRTARSWLLPAGGAVAEA